MLSLVAFGGWHHVRVDRWGLLSAVTPNRSCRGSQRTCGRPLVFKRVDLRAPVTLSPRICVGIPRFQDIPWGLLSSGTAVCTPLPCLLEDGTRPRFFVLRTRESSCVAGPPECKASWLFGRPRACLAPYCAHSSGWDRLQSTCRPGAYPAVRLFLPLRTSLLHLPSNNLDTCMAAFAGVIPSTLRICRRLPTPHSCVPA